mmetsp:Transcript_9982/g.15621  ORF Transcript_9982/g.15621 Transcript_9982/m.15621 type:complete len:84 (+) Transcript_9982:531-782(+)
MGEELCMSDLKYARCLWSGAQARGKLLKKSKSSDDPVKTSLQARHALRVYATTLGSSHWFVRQINSEVKQLQSLCRSIEQKPA